MEQTKDIIMPRPSLGVKAVQHHFWRSRSWSWYLKSWYRSLVLILELVALVLLCPWTMRYWKHLWN